jgi:tetratricopeptide (TPR) repeat protein
MLKQKVIVLALATFAMLFGLHKSRADDLQKARSLYQQGSQHYDLNEYTQALELFKEAYRSHEEPAILYNIAQCYRQLGDSENAIRFYRSFLNKADVPLVLRPKRGDREVAKEGRV